MTKPLANSYWVIPDRLLAGEHPFGEGPLDAQNRFASLRDAGIDFFMDLTEIGERPAYQRLLHRSMDYVRFPIVDSGLPTDDEQMHRIQQSIETALSRKRKIYVHCRAGIGRTGLVVGCFLAQEARSGKAALKQLNNLWKQSARSRTWARVPQTEQQTEYILRWADPKKSL